MTLSSSTTVGLSATQVSCHSAAEQLKEACVRQLKEHKANVDVAAGLVAAVNLCNKYLSTAVRTPQASKQLATLQATVTKAIKKGGIPPSKKPAPLPLSSTKSRTKNALPAIASAKSTARSMKSTARSMHAVDAVAAGFDSVDYTMPQSFLEQGARKLDSDYLAMSRKQDAKVGQEDAAAREKIRAQQRKTRADLLEQMAEHREQDAARLLEKRRELVSVNSAVSTWEKEEAARAEQARQKARVMQADRNAQVDANAERRRVERLNIQYEDAQMLRRMEMEAAEEERKKAAYKAKQKKQLMEVQDDNKRKLAERAAAKTATRADDERLMKEYEAELERRDLRRRWEVEETKRKMLARYHAGGGEALTASLAEQAAMDEARAQAATKAMADAEDERERQKVARRRAGDAAQRKALDAQIAQAERERQLESMQAAEYAKQVRAEAEELEREKRKAKADLKAVKVASLAERKAELKDEARRRFDAARDIMPTEERKMQRLFLG